MGFQIKHIHKYVRWVGTTHRQYRQDCRNVGRTYAGLCLKQKTALLLQRQEMIRKTSMDKHAWVLSYMENACRDTVEKYRDFPAPANLHALQPERKVWSMWWQGEQNADKLFRMCIESARRHTGETVIVLDQDNYSQYIDIPEFILQKHREGKIALQHVCDYIVVSVLAQQGGFFTGATVWWSQDATDALLRAPFYTCRAVTKDQTNMSRSRWVGYLLAGNREFPLFPFVRDCLTEYWSREDRAVDYLMMDYIFELAYENIPCVREMIDGLPKENNMLRNELISCMGEKYDPENFRKYTEGDTFLYKLSWKFGNKDLRTKDGSPTNYAHMLAECAMEEIQ